MFKSFTIQHFRGLRQLEIHKLARINLIVGDNDTGKTALLEALFAHLAQANISALVNLKGFRRMVVSPDETCWRDFFSDLDDSRAIELISVDSQGRERKSTMSVGQHTQISLAVPQQVSGGSTQSLEKPFSPATSYRPLRVRFENGSDRPITNDLMFDVGKKAFIQTETFSPDLKAFYFSTSGPPDMESIAKFLSDLLVSKRDEDLISVAKVIDSNMQKLSVASPKGISEVFVDIGQPHLLQLTLFGSGVVRAIAIASAIPAHASGALLIDEIDSGIYYTRLGDFWRAISQMAKKYDVQIFASTHSSECVRAAIQNVVPDIADSDPLHVYRMIPGRSSPVPYEHDSLRSVVELMAEVR